MPPSTSRQSFRSPGASGGARSVGSSAGAAVEAHLAEPDAARIWFKFAGLAADHVALWQLLAPYLPPLMAALGVASASPP